MRTFSAFAALAALLIPASAFAADSPVPSTQSLRGWTISLAPVLASQALDASSSWGMRELNPVLAGSNGGFGGKAAGIKLGVTGALLGVEYLVIRKHPGSAKVFAKLNWASAVVTTSFAVHNFTIR